MKIVIPGSCRKCNMACEVVERVIREAGVDVELPKIDDIEEMLRLGVRTMPAIIVDGKVAVKGHVPSEEDVRRMIGLCWGAEFDKWEKSCNIV